MRTALVLSLAALFAACDATETKNALVAPEPMTVAMTSELLQATAAFHDVDKAVAAGYQSPDAAACVEVAGLGAMGVHSVNFALVTDLVIDPLQPEVLLYLPKKGGGFRLVGVEYIAPALVLTPTGPAPWFAQSAPPYPFFNPAPSVFGQTFDGPMPGHEPGQPWHYDKHVWVWSPNPAGQFAQFNPTLSCAGV